MKSFPWILSALLLAALFIAQECHQCPDQQTVTIRDTTYLPGDSVKVKVKEHVPVPYAVDRYLPAAPFDTMAAIAQYFTRYFYADTIRRDSMLVIILDTVGENKIRHRSVYWQNLRGPMVIRETVIQKEDPRHRLFIGGVATYAEKPGAGAALLLITKKDHGYSYTYDGINNSHTVGIYYKISLRRKKPP